MTPDDFSALARDLAPGVQEKKIFDTVRYRLGGKGFATVGWPEVGWAVVKIAPSRQAWALALSEGLAPEPGRRRNSGIVLVRLAAVDDAVAIELLAAALSFAYRTPDVRPRSGAYSSAGSRRLFA